MRVFSKPAEDLTVAPIFCLLSNALCLIFEKSSLKLFSKVKFDEFDYKSFTKVRI